MPGSSRRQRLLVLTLIFPPDGVSTAQLLGEIAEDLHGADFDVSVLTTSPHYNVDSEAQSAQPIAWRWHRLVGVSEFHGIQVTHIRMPQKAAGSVARAAQWAWFHCSTLFIGVFRRKRIDVMLTVSPPPTVALVASLIHKISGAPFVFAVWELYPEILVKLGKLSRDSVLHRVLKAVERRTYRASGAITVLHDPMKQAVISALPAIADKVHTLPTFADTNFLRPVASDLFRDEYQLSDRFVVGYAGNLGVSQDLKSVLEAATLLKHDDGLAFLIAGDGSERKGLEDYADHNGLKNVIFTGHLPYRTVPELTAACDLCIVTLAQGVSDEALPSKVYRIMACGRPILGITSEPSPLAHLINEFQIGTVCPPSDGRRLAETINLARQAMDLDGAGTRARKIAEERFSRAVIIRRYGELLRSLLPDDSESFIG